MDGLTDRSVPFKLEGGSEIRFDRADIKAMENALGAGYPHFIRPEIFISLSAMEIFVWRGLRKEVDGGNLIHVFPLDDAGRERAGDAVMAFIADDKNDVSTLHSAIRDGFVACGLFKRLAQGGGEKPSGAESKKGKSIKN